MNRKILLTLLSLMFLIVIITNITNNITKNKELLV